MTIVVENKERTYIRVRKMIGDIRAEILKLTHQQTLEKKLLRRDHRTLDAASLQESCSLRAFKLTKLHRKYSFLRGKRISQALPVSYRAFRGWVLVKNGKDYTICHRQQLHDGNLGELDRVEMGLIDPKRDTLP